MTDERQFLILSERI